MASVNRYYQPSEYLYVSLYTPVPFNELYQVGAYYNKQRQDIENKINEYQRKIGEFISPSDIDILNYNRIAMDPIKPVLDEAKQNPSVMNDPMWRSKLNSAINSVDYGSLSRLTAGAKNLYERQKNVAELISRGDYNPNWDDYADLSTYSTLDQGILKELSPLQYLSLVELSSPYVDKLKPTFYSGSVDPNTGLRRGWTSGYMSITNDDLRRSLDLAKNEILSTPQGSRWYKDYIRANGGDEEAAWAQMQQAMITDQSQKLISTPIDDKLGFAQWEMNEKMKLLRAKIKAASGGDTQLTGTIPATELLNQGAKQSIDAVTNKAAAIILPDAYEELNRKMLLSEMSNSNNPLSTNNYNINNLFSDLDKLKNQATAQVGGYSNVLKTVIDNELNLTDGNIPETMMRMQNLMFLNYGDARMIDAVNNTFDLSKEKVNTPYGKVNVIYNIGRYKLAPVAIGDVAGLSTDVTNNYKLLLNYLIKRNVSAINIGANGYASVPQTDGYLNIASNQVALSEEDLMYLADELGVELPKNDTKRTKLRQDVVRKFMEECGYVRDIKYVEKRRASDNKIVRVPEIYYKVDITNNLPKTNDLQRGSAFNSVYDKITQGTTGARDEYPIRQEQALYAGELTNTDLLDLYDE